LLLCVTVNAFEWKIITLKRYSSHHQNVIATLNIPGPTPQINTIHKPPS
jgi:hypothetical protein